MLGFVMSLLVFVAVLMRYLIASPLHFSDELVALLFSACVFLTIPYTFAMNLSIRVTLITDVLPARFRRISDILSTIGCVVFFLLLGYLSYNFASFSLMIDARSDVTRLPVGLWMSIIPVSAFLTAIIIVVKEVLASSSVYIGTEEERQAGEVI